MIRYVLLGLLGILTVDAATVLNSTARAGCTSPFSMIGERCIHIDYQKYGSWDTLNTYCQDIGGSYLAVVNDANFLADLVQHIKFTGWSDSLYWIGATDLENEGHWKWVNNDPVKMGTPFWSTYGCYDQQYPDGTSSENCALLDGNVNLYFNDFNCEGAGITNIYGICEKKL